MFTRIISIICAALLLAAAPAVAQTADIDYPGEEKPLRLKGKHLVAGNVGFLTELSSSSTVEVGGGVSVANDAGGATGALRYSYWGQEEFALDFLLGGTALDASVSVGTGGSAVESATITRFPERSAAWISEPNEAGPWPGTNGWSASSITAK